MCAEFQSVSEKVLFEFKLETSAVADSQKIISNFLFTFDSAASTAYFLFIVEIAPITPQRIQEKQILMLNVSCFALLIITSVVANKYFCCSLQRA